ncbi:retrovirus-related pol polyprotein from transposon TNT 1-94 [Tanacetum coccineum]
MPDHVKPTVLAPGMYAIDVELIPPQNRNNREVHLEYLKHLKKSVGTLREIVEEVMAEKPLDSSLASDYLYTKHSQELLKNVIGTCPKDFNKRDRKIATAPLNRKKVKQFKQVWQATGKLFTNVGFQWQPTGRKFTLGEQCPLTRFAKSKVVPVKQPKSVSTSKIMITERLSNTSQKLLTRTPTAIRDLIYQTLHIRLFSNAGRTDRPLVFGHRMFKTYDGGSLTAQEFHKKCDLQGILEAAWTMLIFSKALMFLWAAAVATACYTQNRSLIHTRHNKTPYELVHDRKPDLKFLRVFGALCYPTNES